MLESFIMPLALPGLVVLGSILASPDFGWLAGAIAATIWLDSRFRRIERRIDKLPCVNGKHCLHELDDETTTL